MTFTGVRYLSGFITKKNMYSQDANFFVTGGTVGCHNNLRCYHRRQYWHRDNCWFVVIALKSLIGCDAVVATGIACPIVLLQNCVIFCVTMATVSYVYARPIFTRRTEVSPQDIVKSRSREIGCYNDHIALKFDRHLGSVAAEVPVKFQSDWKSLNPNLAASRLHKILR